MQWIRSFTDPACADIAVTGGKAANLAKLTAAELPVPPGFCVVTDAYRAHIEQASLASHIEDVAGRALKDADTVEAATAALREDIVTTPLAAEVETAIGDAYLALGNEPFVAVRSSGTAEDLADASFAGLHDTYLDVRGVTDVLDAVRRCWASMWTARATSYRATRGFDQQAAGIAVVVQVMVEADVAGVMFTANPLNERTDELVINAAPGLGEALVSGITTPDEIVLTLPQLRVRSERIGAKEKMVVRDPIAGSGTVTQDVPAADRERASLGPDQVRRLGELGQRVMAHYEGVPQDIEWAIAGDDVFVLQSRPVTGATFSWDEDLEFWQHFPDDDAIVWSHTWALELWNGGVSPLTYSYRGGMFSEALDRNMSLWGIDPLDQPAYRYHRGTVYYNTAVDARLARETAPQPFRLGMLAHVRPDEREQVLAAPNNVRRLLRMYWRISTVGRPIHGPRNFWKTVDNYLQERQSEADGLSREELTRLSDDELIGYFERFAKQKATFTGDLWTGFFIFARDAVSLMAGMIAQWHDPEPQLVITDLLSGLPERTATAEENLWLWHLSDRIRRSPELRAAFERAGENYLEAFEASAEGRAFLEDYGRFLRVNAHRGHADRDMWYPRRGDDPSIDYGTFRALLVSSGATDPEQREREVGARRDAVVADVEASLRQRPFGGLLVKIFRDLLAYAHRFFRYRDDQRSYFDRYTYSMKRGAEEFGRRLAERGVLDDPQDAYFLGRPELYGVLRSGTMGALLRRKIAGRRKNFMALVEHRARFPLYTQGGKPLSFESGAQEDDGLVGVGTSRGQVTGRARIVLDLSDIGQLQDGDILVTHSTDPGWTPVFNLLSGIVLETGGVLAHGSCLAREYGFPAVQIANAADRIPDGALITVDGDSGRVTIEPEPVPSVAAAAAV